jgi:LacI family transcriptional regulator
MRTLPKPVGVVACYDIRGQQVLDACRATRLRVPDEVAVIGQHNDELLCDLCNPPLTSVIPNARRAGFVAAQLLHGMMHRRRTHAARVIEIAPVGVTTRASTDTVAVADPRLAAALRHLQTHASGSVLIKEVARHAGLLERGFRSHFGCAPDEHLLRLRMDRARRLLLETDLPTAEVAAQCGFQSAEHFSATFRQREGRSPAAFRRGGVIATSPR